MKYLNLSFLIVFCFIMNVSLLAQDALEPNDTKETAYDITSQLASANGDLTISNLSITANNPDFYKLVVSERSSLKLNFLFNPGNGNYDLDSYIYNSSMSVIASGESGTPNEYMEIGDLPAGTYYFKIYGWGGATNNYAMHVSRTTFSPDDSYEPNDTKATATNLTSSLIAANGQLTLNNLAIVSGNQDWFKLTLSATSTINATVTFTHANGNLDAQIFNAADNSLALGNSTTNNESLSTATLSPGTYYLKIFGATATVANTYSLFLESNNYIQDDTYEPNDTKSAATNLTADFVSGACYKSGLRINTGNEDWFKVVLTQAGTLNVVVVFTPGGGDRDIDSYIYNESNTLLSSGESGSPNEVMSTGSVSAGTYYIRIYGYNGANNNYDLDLSFQASGNQPPVALSQTVSVNEDNSLAITLTGTDPENNTLTYSIVTQPSHGTLSGSNANRVYTPSLNYFGTDSFTFKVNDGLLDSQEATISITVNGINDAPTIQNLLVTCIKNGGNHFTVIANDVENDFLTYSIITNPEHGVITSTGTPGYYIYTPSSVLLDDVMILKVNDGNIDSSVATVNFRVDDRFEENDTSATAYDLTAEVNAAYGHFDEKNMLILSGDTDWFKLVVTERSELDLNLIFSPGNGLFDLDVYVYNGNLNEIENSESGNDNEAISIGDLPAGTYYIQVLGWAGGSNDYETQIELRPYSPDDIYEENDSKVSAYNLTNKLVLANGQLDINNLNLLNNDPDWYKVTTVASASLIKWQINFSNLVGNLDMAVYDENETLLQSSVSNSNSEIITLSGLPAGNYYVKIYGADGVVNDYNLQMEVSSFIVDDSFEENDNKAQASDISNNFIGNNLFINNLKIISNDDDWFKFTTNTTANISAIVVFSPGGGLFDLDAYLEKADGTRLATGESGNDNEVLNANNLPAGTYYIRVTGWAGAHNNYNLQINLVSQNTPPIAIADALTTNEDTVISFNPVTNDTDANGDVLNISDITNGTKGNATFSGNIITYTPNLNNNGSDSLTYTISDGHGGFATGTVTITITPVNDAPIAIADNITTYENITVSFNPVTNESDVDGDILNITATTNGGKGNAIFSGNIVTYTPNPNENGSDSITYTISDGHGGMSTGTVEITIYLASDNFPPVVLPQIKLEVKKNGSFNFDLSAHIEDEEKNSLLYELQYQPFGMSISSSGVIEMTNVGNAILTYDFFVKITDNAQNEITTNIALDVVENLLDPNVIVQLNNSAITISATGNGDSPFVLMQTKLLANSGHDAEWLDTEFDHTNLLTYYGITSLADLPSKITVTITPDEKFRSQNIVKAGIGLLNADGQFQSLYETTDKIYTGSYNRFDMTVNAREVNSSTVLFTQGLNKVVMFTQLANGIVTYYEGSNIQLPVTPYNRSTIDPNRTYSVVQESGQSKYQYNYLLGLANGIVFDDKGPTLVVLNSFLMNDKITLAGSIEDTVGADFMDATLSIKNSSGDYVAINPNTYQVTKNISNGAFVLEILDKDASTHSISLLNLGDKVRINLIAKDYLNNLNDSDFIDLDYYPLDEIVRIDTLTAVQGANTGLATINYQATIVDSANYELEEIKLNDNLEVGAGLAGVFNKPAIEGSNFYTLTVKVKNKNDSSISFKVEKSVRYAVLTTVTIQNFTVSGNANTLYNQISGIEADSRNIFFEIANPNNFPLNIKLSIFDHFTQEETGLNYVEYEPGKYRVSSDLEIFSTNYTITLKVSSINGLVNKEEILGFQNGPFAVTTSGSFNLVVPPTLIGVPNGAIVKLNGEIINASQPLPLEASGPITIEVNGVVFQANVSSNSQFPGIDSLGISSDAQNYDASKKVITITYPLKPASDQGTSINLPIIYTTNQYLRGKLSSKYKSMMIKNNTHPGSFNKEVTAELKSIGKDEFEFSAYLNFLVPGENNLLITAYPISDKEAIVSMPYVIILDRNGPEVSVTFGPNYDSVPIPKILGFLSFYNSLMVGNNETFQTDYDFYFEINDDYLLDTSLDAVKKKLKISFGGIDSSVNDSGVIDLSSIDLNNFDLQLVNNNKKLTGRIKDKTKISAVGNEKHVNGNFFVMVEIKDYANNKFLKYRPYQFDRGAIVELNFKSKPTKINLDSAAQLTSFEFIPFSLEILSQPSQSYLFEHDYLPFDYIGNWGKGGQLIPKKTALPSANPPAFYAEQDTSNSRNTITHSIAWLDNILYEGGAVEQAQLFTMALETTTLTVNVQTMVGGAQIYIPKRVFASGRSVVNKPNDKNVCHDFSFFLNGAPEFSNNVDLGLYFYDVTINPNDDYYQIGQNLAIGLIQPSAAYSRTGLIFHDVPFTVGENQPTVRNFISFGQEMATNSAYIGNPSSQPPVPAMSPLNVIGDMFSGDDKTNASISGITIVIKSKGYIVNDVPNSDKDTFTFNLLAANMLVGGSLASNKFNTVLSVDHSTDQEVTSHFVATNYPNPYDYTKPPWADTEIFDPDDTFNIDSSKEYLLIQELGLIDHETECCQDPNPTNCSGFYGFQTNYTGYKVYIQEVGDTSNTADVVYNLKLGESLPAELEFRITVTENRAVNGELTSTETPETLPWLRSQIIFPPLIGHYKPLPSYYFWEDDSSVLQNTSLKNKLELYVEGVSLFKKNLGGEGQKPEAYVQPSFFNFQFGVEYVFVNDDKLLYYKQNIAKNVDMTNIQSFYNTYLNGNYPGLVQSKPIIRGSNRFLLSTVTFNGNDYPVYLDVEIGDGDHNLSTDDDLYVVDYVVQSSINLPHAMGTGPQNLLVQNTISQFNGIGSTGRPVTVTSGGKTVTYSFTSVQKAWANKDVTFVTPSYYRYVFDKPFVAGTEPDFILAYPGESIAITDLNTVDAQVKGVKFTKVGGVDINELNMDDEYEFRYYDYIGSSSNSSNPIMELSAYISSYDDAYNFLADISTDNFNTYHEVNSDIPDNTALDEFISSQHQVLPNQGPAYITQNIKLVTKLSQIPNPNTTGKQFLLVKEGGFVGIVVGAQSNIYRVHAKKPIEIEFEAITGITPRVGASSMSSSEFLTIREGTGSVFTHNKQFIHSQLDLAVQGRVNGLSFVRTYRSGVNTHSGLGEGWDHNFNKYITVDEAGKVTWFQGNGRHDTFADLTNLPPGFYCKIEKKDAGTDDENYRISFNDGSYEEYYQTDARFRLSKIVDAYENKIKIIWENNSFTATCDNGKFLSFRSAPELAELSDGNRKVTYVITRNLLAFAELKGASKLNSFIYNQNGMLTDIKSIGNNDLLNITYSEEAGKEYQVASQIQNGMTFTYADLSGGGISQTITAQGTSTVTSYFMQSDDLSSQLSKYPKKIVFPATNTSSEINYGVPSNDDKLVFQIGSVQNQNGVTTVTSYETSNDFKKGFVKKIEVFKAPGSIGPNSIVTMAVAEGEEYTTLNINGNTIFFPKKRINGNGYFTSFEYNPKGDVIVKSEESAVAESGLGEVLTFYKYDKYGRMEGVANPDGTVAVNKYYDFVDETLTLQATGWLRRTIVDNNVGTGLAGISRIGQLLEMSEDEARNKDNNLQVTDFAYDKWGNVATVVDTHNQARTTEFDIIRRPILITGPDFKSAGHNKTLLIYKGKDSDDSDRGWATWTNRVDSIIKPEYIMETLQSFKEYYNEEALYKQNTFNSFGWQTSYIEDTIVREIRDLDGFGRIRSITHPFGHGLPDKNTNYKYDARFNVVKIVEGDNDTDPDNALSIDAKKIAIVQEYTFDAANNIVVTKRGGVVLNSKTLDGFDRPVGLSEYSTNIATKIELDNESQVVNAKTGLLTRSDGSLNTGSLYSHVSMIYDKLGETAQTTDNIRNAVYQTKYNILQNEVKMISPVSSPTQAVGEATVTSVSNKLSKAVTYPDGTVVTTEMNADGTVNHITQDESNVAGIDGQIKMRRTKFDYDENGFLIKEYNLVYDGSKFVTPSANKLVQNTYINDSLGRKVLVTDGVGNKTKYDYNKLGQLEKVTTGFVADVSANSNNKGIVKKMTYYDNGQLFTEFQGGLLTRYEYTPRGDLLNITYIQAEEITVNGVVAFVKVANTTNEMERFLYNERGLLKSKGSRHKVHENGNQIEAPVNLLYFYEYEMDENTTGADETDYLAQIKIGNKIVREYREPGSSDEVSFYENGQPKIIVEHNRFIGNTIDPTGDVKLELGYNSSRQLDSEKTTIKDFNNVEKTKTVTRNFDTAGNLKNLIYPGTPSQPLIYEHNTMNQLSKIHGLLPNDPIFKDIKYYGLGKVGSTSEGNGKILQKYSYDNQNWVSRINGNIPSANDTNDFKFTRYNNGLKKSVEQSQASGSKGDFYDYDNHNRLVYAQYIAKQLGSTDSFGLDDLDNFTSNAFVPTIINGTPYNDIVINNLVQHNNTQIQFQYDKSGNTIVDGKFTYQWDDFDRVKSIENPIILSDWQYIEYQYDGMGRRVKKIVDGVEGSWYLFDGSRIIEEYTLTTSAEPTLRRQMVYGADINEPICVTDAVANKTYYLLKNDQNSVMSVYDGINFSIKEHYEYSAYGITAILDANNIVKTVASEYQIKSDLANPFGFQGMWRDEHTGLYHTHYRLYNPQFARWLTPDPAGYMNGMNLYRFYGGPNGVDPLGDFAFVPILIYALFLTAVDSAIGTGVDVYQGNEITTGGQLKRVGGSFAINAITGGFATYAQAAKWSGKAIYATSIALDTTLGTAYDTSINGQDFNTALATNFAGSVLGNNIALGVTKAFGKTPGDFGLKSLYDHGANDVWVESMIAAAKGRGSQVNNYQRLLTKLENGINPTGKDYSDAFETVVGYFNLRLSKAKISLPSGPIHHWNYNKSDFPDLVFDSRNLFPTKNVEQHKLIHDLTSSGGGYGSNRPIDPKHVLELGSGRTILPKSYFKLKE